MSVLHQLQPSFNNGEISPLLYDRVDFQKFVSSVKSGKNMFVHPQGGMSNRAGTVMLAAAKDEVVRLIPFEFSSTETYVIEFGNGYCRFFTTNGQVVVEEEIEGETVQFPYEIQSPFTTADLDKIRYCQSGDVMYLAWGGKPKTLTRYGHANWQISDYDFKNGPLLQSFDSKENELSISYDSDIEKYILNVSVDLFTNNDVGRLVGINKSLESVSIYGTVNNSSYVSNIYLCGKGYIFKTTGTWSGEIVLQFSKDKLSWDTERVFSSVNDTNYSFTGQFDEDINWVRIKGNITSGTCYINFTSDTEQIPIFFKINSVESPLSATATYQGSFVGIEDAFSGEDEGATIEGIIPWMTSNTAPSGEAYSNFLNNDAYRCFMSGLGYTGPGSAYWFYTGEDRTIGYKPGFSFYLKSLTFQDAPYNDNYSFNNLYNKFEVYGSYNGGNFERIEYVVTKIDRFNRYRENVTLVFSTSPLIDDIRIVVNVHQGSSDWMDSTPIYYIRANGIKSEGGDTGKKYQNWSLGLWSDASYYPTEVELYQDRITWITNNQIDATKISDYTNFGVSTDVTEDDAISVIVKDKKIDKINSIVAGQKLAVYSDDGNFVHHNDTFTPNSATFLKQGATGGSDVKPVVVRDHIIYAHPMKQAISDYAYSFETDGYAGQDITLLANHLFDGKVIKTLAYQQEPYSIIWVLQEEGTVLACTYLRQQNVIAWTPMDFGGTVKSIAVCSTGTEEHLYLAVERENGTFVEKMPTRLLSAAPDECFFVDCGRTYRGEPATVISGLNYLEGEQVVALADGNVIKELTVENGQITLPVAASVVTVGLPYESVLETLTFDVNTGDGSHLNRKKRVVAVSIRYNNSRGSRISVNGHRETDMLKREQEAYNTPISLKSGVYREILPSAHNEATHLKIRQGDPLPITIVSVIPEIEYEQ